MKYAIGANKLKKFKALTSVFEKQNGVIKLK